MTLEVRTPRMSAAALFLVLLAGPAAARADVVTDWNVIAVRTTAAQNPFAQARFLAITQLAVFEAVNAVNGGYEPYLGTVSAAPGASAEAAAVAAAHAVLAHYFPGSAADLLDDRNASLAAIADGPGKTAGIAAGEAAAAKMIETRDDDGSGPPQFYLPGSALAGEWQLTPNCSAAGGAFLQWRNIVPFGIPSAETFILAPPPDLTSGQYAKDYAEVKSMGALNSAARPDDRRDVARFYASVSPGGIMNEAARQLSARRGDSLSQNARAFALINMSISDSLVVSFATKYRYNFWRPETAIRAGASDANGRTEGDTSFAPLVGTPCFPSYPSNHASGTNGGLEMLRRLYGAARHSLTLSNAGLGVSRQYTSLNQIADDVDDARVYGGIHFRFDQDGGNRLGRNVAAHVIKHNLRALGAAQ